MQPFQGIKKHSQQLLHPFHPSMCLFMSSRSRQYSPAASATRYQDSLVSWAPCFAGCQRKGQPSFSQQRCCRCHILHKNLHNSNRKCQYTKSLVIRPFRHYSTSLWFRGISDVRLMLFSSWMCTLSFSFGSRVWRKDSQVLENLSQKWKRPLLFLTGFW